MSIKIKRNSSIMGSLMKERLLIDQKELPAIGNNQELEVELPQSPATLTIKSNKQLSATVKDGDQVVLASNPNYIKGIVAFIVCFIISKLIFNATVLGFVLLFTGLGFAFYTLFMVPRYRIEITNQDNELASQ